MDMNDTLYQEGVEHGMAGRMSILDQTARAKRAGIRLSAGAALAALIAALAPAAWAAPPLLLELNKLETLPQSGSAGAGGCRAYLVVQNPAPEPLEQLRLDLVLFGTDGVIARRVALELGPLAPGKTAVRLFDLQGLPCEEIGRMLVNDVVACRTGGTAPADQDRAGCLDRLAVSSRATTPFVK